MIIIMGIIIPNHINHELISIVPSFGSYKVVYNTPYIHVNGLVLRLKDVVITPYSSYYGIVIKDQESIDSLKRIEEHLQNKVPNYKHSLKYNNSIHYITIKRNHHTESIINKYYGKADIYINLLRIIRNAFHSYLIIYIA